MILTKTVLGAWRGSKSMAVKEIPEKNEIERANIGNFFKEHC